MFIENNCIKKINLEMVSLAIQLRNLYLYDRFFDDAVDGLIDKCDNLIIQIN